jgi:uncharacterized protein (UPF0305 family)
VFLAERISLVNPTDYETLTRAIAEEVVNASPNLQRAVEVPLPHGLRNKIEGVSGFKHQIDVSIEIPNKKLFLVECKRYKKKVTVSDMLILIARINDIKRKRTEQQVEGCFFTTEGYTKPAIKVGTFYDIELNTVEGIKRADIKRFAVHVAENTFIQAEAAKFNPSASGQPLLEPSPHCRKPEKAGSE